MNMKVDIWFDTRPYEKYPSSRSGNGTKGPLKEAIAHIDNTIAISDYDSEYSTTSGGVAHITGITDKSLAQLTEALYSNENVSSRIKHLKTSADILKLSSTQQAHVPAEQEIIAHHNVLTSTKAMSCDGGIECDPDYCPIHGT